MLEMMLKTLIAALDLKIDPAEVEAAFERAKTMLPEIAVKMRELEERSVRMENLLLSIVSKQAEAAKYIPLLLEAEPDENFVAVPQHP